MLARRDASACCNLPSPQATGITERMGAALGCAKALRGLLCCGRCCGLGCMQQESRLEVAQAAQCGESARLSVSQMPRASSSLRAIGIDGRKWPSRPVAPSPGISQMRKKPRMWSILRAEAGPTATGLMLCAILRMYEAQVAAPRRALAGV